MKSAHHELTRKEMKAPDRFQQVAGEAASWAAARKKQLAVVGVLVLALAIFAVAVSYFMDARRAKAGALLSAAITAASGEVSATGGAAQPGTPVYKTAEEKAQAVIAAAGAVRAQGGSARASATADLLEGDAQLTLKAWDAAIAAFQRHLATAGSDDSLRYMALDGLARAQEGKGDLAAAAKTWEDASALKSFKDRAILERARVLAKAGKVDDAKKALESIPEDSPLRPEAQERLGRLGAK